MKNDFIPSRPSTIVEDMSRKVWFVELDKTEGESDERE